MALFTGAFFVAQVSLIIVANPFSPFFVHLVYLTSQKRVYCLPDGGQPGTSWNAVVRNETDLAN